MEIRQRMTRWSKPYDVLFWRRDVSREGVMLRRLLRTKTLGSRNRIGTLEASPQTEIFSWEFQMLLATVLKWLLGVKGLREQAAMALETGPREAPNTNNDAGQRPIHRTIETRRPLAASPRTALLHGVAV